MASPAAAKSRTRAAEKAGAVWRLCPVRHVLTLLFAAMTVLYFALRGSPTVMTAVSRYVTRPYHAVAGRVCAAAEWSVAELLIGLTAAAIAVYITIELVYIRRRRDKLVRALKLTETVLCVALGIYAGFCLLWGGYYYADSGADYGVETGRVSVDELYAVTKYFAGLANEYGELVERDGQGCFAVDEQELLDKSKTLYRQIEELYPELAGEELRVKPVYFSKIMSYLDFTGFFFPFTGEANVNMDSPKALLPSTIAHELAHQRGVAPEQEANFTAVLASLENGDADYCYSSALLAYIHLGNALYREDNGRWQEVYASLSEGVRADLKANNAYWAQFETVVSEVSNTVYTGFLQGYGQELGLKSYGACIDLLIAYYRQEAFAENGG